ncbi:hypothetical protein B0A48_05736 [Cryoendolithus antarcticus]|uniref:Glutathione S-transferase kappa n=1 Tax=Cryoendolithus antarcticus TaxID=1507870 RepID=A0A1V8TBT6_9PEZI|nr:hypothetical protein B0A48_05736 [Cryoendolithus antarcticus]
MARPKLTLYLDIVSPFAYIAFYVVQNNPIFKRCDVTYIPIFLGGVMQACGNTPPIKIRNKDKWIGLERDRWATRFNIPIFAGVPEGFPANTLASGRTLALIEREHPSQLPAAYSALFRTYWVDGSPVQKPEVVASALATVFGKAEAEELVARTGEAEVKKLLNSNTELALQSGAFGLPWFECTNSEGVKEGFWGVDHFGQVVDFLGLERREGGEGFRSML